MPSRPLIDNLSAETLAATLSWFEQRHEAGLSCWALLDRAFLTEPSWRRLCSNCKLASLYAGRFNNADAIAPRLLAIPADYPAVELRTWLDSWIQFCQGLPMVSYLSASPSLDIQAWLLARAQVQSPEERLMLRLADTRCLPQILTTLDAYQRSALLQEIGDWRYYDRYGQWQSLLPATELTDPRPSDISAFSPLILTDFQKRHLLAQALPDTVFSYLAGKPEIFGLLSGKPSGIYDCIAQALTATEDNGSTSVTHEQLQGVLQALVNQKLQIREARDLQEATA